MSDAAAFVSPVNPPARPEVHLQWHPCCCSPSCIYPDAGSRRKAF